MNCTKDFTIYTQKIKTGIQKYELQLNGVYVSKQRTGFIYFYPNGMVKFIPVSPEYTIVENNPQKEFDKLLSYGFMIDKDYWGAYYLIQDSLVIQWFNRNNNEICKRTIFEEKAILNSDSSFTLLSRYSKYFDDNPEEVLIEFIYFESNVKPDCNLAWFHNKMWYRKKLNESRTFRNL